MKKIKKMFYLLCLRTILLLLALALDDELLSFYGSNIISEVSISDQQNMGNLRISNSKISISINLKSLFNLLFVFSLYWVHFGF